MRVPWTTLTKRYVAALHGHSAPLQQLTDAAVLATTPAICSGRATLRDGPAEAAVGGLSGRLPRTS